MHDECATKKLDGVSFGRKKGSLSFIEDCGLPFTCEAFLSLPEGVSFQSMPSPSSIPHASSFPSVFVYFHHCAVPMLLVKWLLIATTPGSTALARWDSEGLDRTVTRLLRNVHGTKYLIPTVRIMDSKYTLWRT